MSRLILATVLLLALVTCLACDGGPTTASNKTTAKSTVEATPAIKTKVKPAKKPTPKATDLDPYAMDEALRQALVDLRNKFRCNSISGCKAHAVLVNFGERARPALQHMFPTAPFQAQYRSRIIRIIAEIQSPGARTFLRSVLKDSSDKARAYAVYGLALLNDRRDQELMHNYANAPGIIASAMTRVAAAWGLGYLGDPAYAKRFVGLVHEAADHQLGGATLRWALELCRVPRSPSCRGTLELAARHPSYVVRREVLRAVDTSRASARALLILVADPNGNLARRAETALRRISGRGDIRGVAAWRKWLDSSAAPKG